MTPETRRRWSRQVRLALVRGVSRLPWMWFQVLSLPSLSIPTSIPRLSIQGRRFRLSVPTPNPTSIPSADSNVKSIASKFRPQTRTVPQPSLDDASSRSVDGTACRFRLGLPAPQTRRALANSRDPRTSHVHYLYPLSAIRLSRRGIRRKSGAVRLANDGI